MLVAYSDDESDGDEPPAQAAPIAPLRLPAVAATALGLASSSDDDDDDEPPAKRQAPEKALLAEDKASAETSSNAQTLLPDFEEAISNAQLPAFLSVPAGEFEHVAFNHRPAPAPEVQPAAAAAEAAPAAGSGSKSAMTAPVASRDKRAPSAKAASAADKEKDRQSLKDRTKEKRKKDQSASFLGGRWKSEEEMHMRDNFDS